MKRKCLAIGIILLFLGVVVAPSINISVVKASRIITFPSCISIEYDEEFVNQTEFIPDNAYIIPVSIGYRVWVPVFFFNSHFFLFALLKNWILFHSLIVPVMTINISVENAPLWTDIYPVTSDILVDIGNEYFIAKTNVMVVIHNQAPPGPFTFSLHAESPQLHRIEGYSISRSITITVQ